MNMSGFTPPNMNWGDTNLPIAWDKFHSYLPGHLAKGLKERENSYCYCGWDKKEDIFTIFGFHYVENKFLTQLFGVVKTLHISQFWQMKLQM